MPIFLNTRTGTRFLKTKYHLKYGMEPKAKKSFNSQLRFIQTRISMSNNSVKSAVLKSSITIFPNRS